MLSQLFIWFFGKLPDIELIILFIVHVGHTFSILVLINEDSGLSYPFMVVSRHFRIVLTFSISFQSRHIFFFLLSVDNQKGQCIYFSFYFILKTFHWQSSVVSWMGSEMEDRESYGNTRPFFTVTDMFPVVTKPWDAFGGQDLVELLSSYHTVILGIMII